MKKIAILGSTGSIGRSALEVVRHFPDRFRVVSLSTNTNIAALSSQIGEFHPRSVCVADPSFGNKLKAGLKEKLKVFTGKEGLKDLVCEEEVDQVLVAISGIGALASLLAAIKKGRQIALANKEAMVAAGPIIMREAAKKKVKIMPIDSEESAIWQCLEGRDKSKLKNIYLTASGGPLRKIEKKDLKDISLRQVLKHPRWKMGKKITVDSATLMNKGLELLETMFLFGMPCDKIKILIHPEALVHSMVEFIDGVILAQLSATDMRIPIQYALSYPERLSNSLPVIDFYKLNALTFDKPDFKKFPCLRLAYQVAKDQGTAPAVLNAANEVSVDEFLGEKIKFISIPGIIEKVLSKHRNKANPGLTEILEADKWARQEAHRIIEGLT